MRRLSPMATHARTGQQGGHRTRPQGEGGRTKWAAALTHPAGRPRVTCATRHGAEQNRQSCLPLHPMRGSLTHAVHTARGTWACGLAVITLTRPRSGYGVRAHRCSSRCKRCTRTRRAENPCLSWLSRVAAERGCRTSSYEVPGCRSGCRTWLGPSGGGM